MISAICPGCNIVLVEASSSGFSNLDAAVAYAQNLNPAAITNSYGGSEFSSETSYNGTYSAGPATAVTAATGDNGYGVEFPAASPGLTAVGGTSLSYSGTGSNLVWNPQTAWSSAGSGCSAFESLPAWQDDPGVYSLSSDCAARQVGDVSAVLWRLPLRRRRFSLKRLQRAHRSGRPGRGRGLRDRPRHVGLAQLQPHRRDPHRRDIGGTVYR